MKTLRYGTGIAKVRYQAVLRAQVASFFFLLGITLLCLFLDGMVIRAAAAVFPDYRALTQGPWQPVLLPGQREFVFTIYGAPSELSSLRRVVALMQENNLGNGFDPGPAARAVNKLLKGDCVLSSQDQASLDALDRAGIFNAIQLGEWGYYFHNLACNEHWWREVYGKDFEAHRHLMKPPGLAGYDRVPTTRRECYENLKDYFTSRSRDLLNRTISVTGHSHYEAYAAEWGARCVGLEVGENIAFTQSKLAFARGASRQWQRPWSVQVSPWFAGACTSSGPLRKEGGGARGLDAGHSLSCYERMWQHGWFAGAAMVTPENSMAIFFEPGAEPSTLTTHGLKAAEIFRFMREHKRGVPWTPVAIVLDHLAGYNAYMDKPWGILEPTTADREVRDLFDHQLFPGSDHIHTPPNLTNPEGSYLRPTPYGESFDVLLTTASPALLSTYPAILLAGDIEFDRPFLDSLTQALQHGARVFISKRHQEALGGEFDVLKRQGVIEVLEPWVNPRTKRGTAVSDEVLQRLVRDFMPVEVSGDSIQYQINRTESGWVFELVNNTGVAKKADQPAVIDPRAEAHVRIESPAQCLSAVEWHSRRVHERPKQIEVVLAPGSTEFVEFVTR